MTHNIIETGRPKVILAFCVQDTVKSVTMLSTVQALHNVNKFDYDILVSMGCDLIGSRTRLVSQAIAIGGTHILFIDHDMYFTPAVNALTGLKENPISRMLSHDKDVIGVAYNFRSLPLRSTALPITEEKKDGKYDVDPETLPKELFKCRAMGTGFLLIKLSVFDKIEKPWFQFGRDEHAELVYGEDTWLCHQAIQAGFEVWCDPTVSVKHVGDHFY
jgi:hypothetical protein